MSESGYKWIITLLVLIIIVLILNKSEQESNLREIVTQGPSKREMQEAVDNAIKQHEEDNYRIDWDRPIRPRRR